MSSPNDANDVLFAGAGAPALQWADPASGQDYPVGTSYEGEIVRTSATAQRDIRDKSKVATWPDGKTKYVALVTIQTSMRDPRFDDDDGQRTLWVSGKYLTNAVKDAVRNAGARQLEEGGSLKVTLTGYGTPQPGFRPPRYFDVAYRKPTPEKRAELAAQKAQQATSDPWANLDQSDPWGAGPVAPQPQASPWGVDPSGRLDADNPQAADRQAAPPQPVAQPPQQPPVGGFDGNATPASVANAMGGGQMDLSGMTPEARALVERMYAQQQGGTQ